MYPGVMPSWDNTARRRGRATVWVNSCPESYYEWLSAVVAIASTKPADERLIFINAWNEWAEGCHLEPDERFGYAWLNATSLALRQPLPVSLKPGDPVSHPDPPPETSIVVQPLSAVVKVVVSVLFYHREDILAEFVRKLLPQLKAASKGSGLSCEL